MEDRIITELTLHLGRLMSVARNTMSSPWLNDAVGIPVFSQVVQFIFRQHPQQLIQAPTIFDDILFLLHED